MSSGANPSPFDACLKWICHKSHPEYGSPTQSPHDHTHPETVSQQPDNVIPMDGRVRTKSEIQPVRQPTNQQSDTWKAFIDTLKSLEASIGVFPPLKNVISTLLVSNQNQQEYDQMARDLTALVQTLQNHLPESKPNRMPYSIENVARAIGEQLAHIKQQQEQWQTGQVILATDNEIDIVGCYRRIETIFHQLQTDVSLSVWDLTRDLWVDARLKDLKPVNDAWHNAGLSMNMHRRGCTPNTRVKILSEAMTWTRNTSAAKIYWMNGMAGTGKTTIAYTLCKQLEESKQLGAGFFCSHASPDCRNVNKIVPTIAYQLARFSNPYQNELCDVLSNTPDVADREISVQYQRLIVDPLMKVKEAIPTDVVIVIDALDECEDIRGTKLVLELLFEHAISLPVKFFVASRPEPSISAIISSSEDTHRFVLHLHDVEGSLVQADIQTYLEGELRHIAAKLEIERLTIRAGCLFIFAATVVRYIEPYDTAVNHRKRLTTMLGIHTAAEQAYQELDGLYLAILTRSLKEVKGDEAGWRRLVLQAVLAAIEPLTIPTIAELIAAESEQDVQLALLPFRSLLRVSVDSKVVTALHASFPDFMFDPARSCDFHCDLSVQNAYMAARCFEIMKRSLRFNICNIETSSKPDQAIPELQTRVTSLISSGLAYVCRYWGDHLGGASFLEALENMLDRFLRHRLLFWMEVLNLKDWIGYGAAILLRALNFLPQDEGQTDLRAMIQDSRNFITTYAASPASQSTPHIYISGLPQTPPHSRVHEIYWPRTKGLFQTQGAAIKNRGDAALATWAVGSPVYTLALSKDGKRITAGLDDGNISVWDANKGIRLVGPLGKHESYVTSVAVSSDGSRIASASEDGTICISNAYTGETPVGPFMGHTQSIHCLSFSSDGAVLASASHDCTIRIWDLHTGTQASTEFTGHSRGVVGVVFTSNGSQLVSCSYDCTIRVWDWKRGVSVNRPFERHTDWVRCIALSPDDSLIASGSDDKTVWVWGIEQGKSVVGPLTGHSGLVISVAFSPNGKQIVSGSNDRTIRVWSSETGDMLAGPFTGHENSVYSVLFSRDGTQVISGSLDRTIRVWDANPSSTGAVMVSSGHTGAIWAIVISPDGTRVISGSYDHTICIWDIHDGTLILGPLTGHTHSVTSLACTHDSTCIISGSYDYTVRTWDAHTGLALSDPFARHGHRVWAVVVSPDGNLIASGAHDGSVKIWNRHDGIQVGAPPTHHTNWVRSLAFSSDSIYLASGSSDWSVCLWDANTGSLVWRSEEQNRLVLSVGFSPSDKTIIACLRDGIVSLDASTGTFTNPSSSWEGSASQIWRDFSFNDTRIAAVAHNGTLCLWDAESGTLLAASTKGAVSEPMAVGLAPDSRRIVAGSENSTIQFWDVDSIEDLEGQGIDSWAPHDDGWIRDSESQLILWLPPAFKHTIPSPESRRYPLLIRSRASRQLYFGSLIYGSHWEDCYTVPPDSDAFDIQFSPIVVELLRNVLSRG